MKKKIIVALMATMALTTAYAMEESNKGSIPAASRAVGQQSFQAIDWDSIYAQARVKPLIDHLNGLIKAKQTNEIKNQANIEAKFRSFPLSDYFAFAPRYKSDVPIPVVIAHYIRTKLSSAHPDIVKIYADAFSKEMGRLWTAQDRTKPFAQLAFYDKWDFINADVLQAAHAELLTGIDDLEIPHEKRNLRGNTYAFDMVPAGYVEGLRGPYTPEQDAIIKERLKHLAPK